jgi:hypothetical protein
MTPETSAKAATGAGAAGRRLLTAVSLVSAGKAVLVATTLVVPAWRLGPEAAWGMPASSVLPITILTCLLYLACGEAARRRAAGAFWFVLVVHGTALFGVVRSPDAGAGLPVPIRVLSVLLSVLVLVLILLPPARRAVRRRQPA